MELCFSAQGLSKRFGEREVLHGVDLEGRVGHALGLLGPNGAGKTTTVRLLAGVLSPTAGDVRLFGTPVTPASADVLRSRIGVQTDTAVYNTLTLRENLRTWADLYGVPRSQVRARIDEVTQLLGLGDRLGSKVGEFSKGMRQKVAVARAVLHRPELLFLDEPTAGLDPEAADDLISYLRTLLDTGDVTVVICTHQLLGLESLCDELAFLDHGRILEAGPIADLIERRWPRQRYRLVVDGAASSALPLLPAGARLDDNNSLSFELPPDQTISDIVASLVTSGVRIAAVIPHEPSVQELYFATIGRQEATR